MKVFIIEGPDNSGKNTLITSILENHDVVKVIHCHKPDKGVEDPFMTMKEIYTKYLVDIIEDNYHNRIDAVVFNRYYQSEYVYGQMYRNGDPEKIKGLISDIEKILIDTFGQENIYYIQLTTDSPELLQNNEDGKSLSDGKIEKIKHELKLFDEVFKISKLKNKKKICISNHGKFRNRKNIVNQFLKYIDYV